VSHTENQGRERALGSPNGLNWRNVGFFVLTVLTLLIFGIAFISVQRETERETESPPDLLVRIRDLSRLSTVEMKLSTVVKITNPRTVTRRLDEVLVYGVCGRVVAGVDLSKIEQADMEINGRQIRIQLPPAEISAPTLLLENDVRSVPKYQLEGEERWVEIEPICEHVYKWTTPGIVDKTPGLILHAQEEGLRAFAKAAEENGIRERAQNKAQELLGKLLLLAGYQEVEFGIKQTIETGQELP
jgi:hypothetical protein